MADDVYTLPVGLPVPEDDGAADHLVGLELPDLELQSSQGTVNVRDFDVIYVYPRTGRPGVPMLLGWDDIPGARGCTPQSCAFRDAYPELGVPVAGLSAQTLDDQREFAERNRMPFPVIADPELKLGAALRLPTFEIPGAQPPKSDATGGADMDHRLPSMSAPPGHTLYKRLTLVAQAARIVKVFYPVFPPDANARDVLRWLRSR